MQRSLLALALFALLAAVAAGAPAEHLVKSLPGFSGDIPFAQYAGLVTIDPARQRQLFYWFCESQRSPASDPVVLWLNGGPGSSSLIGMFVEHGPWRPVAAGAQLQAAYNTSFNRVANVIYLEAPAFVGFSRSGDAGDRTTDDAKVARENYDFIVAWLKLFPEFAKNKFYIVSESYGGHYVPTLAHEILARDTSRAINMKGFAIGNPAINSGWFESPPPDPETDAWPFLTFMYTHGLVPHSAYAAAVDACEWQNYLNDCVSNFTRPSQACLDATQIALDYIPSADIDLYNVDAPICLDSNDFSYTRKWSWAAQQMAARRAKTHGSTSKRDFDPCIFDKMTVYLNEPEVQTALHVPLTKWSNDGDLNYGPIHENMIPYFGEFFRNARSTNWRMLIYSGDLDGCIPYIGTQKWISCLGRPVIEGWRPWYLDSQVAGSVIAYDKISFVTAHGSGHAIPWYTPKLGYELFSRWIDSKPF